MTTVDELQAAIEAASEKKRSRSYAAALNSYKKISGDAEAALAATPTPSVELQRIYFVDSAVGIGDCLTLLELSLSEARDAYARVKSYPLLDQPIRPETLWLKMAQACLAEGDAAYRVGMPDGLRSARAAYELVLRNGAPDATSPLYTGSLQIMVQKVRHWLSNAPADPVDSSPADFPAEQLTILNDVRQRLAQLDSNLNYLGYPDDYAPIFAFEHLREIARGFAQFAAQANREYISFTQQAEAKTETLRQLEQAVFLNQAATEIEQAHRSEVAREIEAAREAERVARVRQAEAERQRDRFATTGWEIVQLDTAQAWAGAGVVPDDEEIRLAYGGLEQLGITGSYQLRSKLIKQLAFERARRSYGVELGRLRSAVRELEAGVALAVRQTAAASARAQAVDLAVQAARWRQQASVANLAAARRETISPELLFHLGRLMRETAGIYLRRAIEAAFLMQQAFNLEYGLAIRKIRFNYGDLDPTGGLYAADLLLRDIDVFTYRQITGQQRKWQGGVRVVSLRHDFPLQFTSLVRTGRMLFSTTLEDFHADLPGTFDGRVKAVAVLVDGPTGADGLVGSLTCAGSSTRRQHDGTTTRRGHVVETMILPRFATRPELGARLAAVGDVAGQLGVFEHVGVAASWQLDLPLAHNDFSYANLSDVRLVIAWQFRHDPVLEQQDLAQAPEDGEAQYSLRLNSTRAPWSELVRTGETTLALDLSLLPGNHDTPRIRDLALIAVRTDGGPQHLVAGLRKVNGGVGGTFTSAADGVMRIEDSAAPGMFADQPMLDLWTLRLDPADNPDLRAITAGNQLDLTRLAGIELAFAYRFKFRRAPEEPA